MHKIIGMVKTKIQERYTKKYFAYKLWEKVSDYENVQLSTVYRKMFYDSRFGGWRYYGHHDYSVWSKDEPYPIVSEKDKQHYSSFKAFKLLSKNLKF